MSEEKLDKTQTKMDPMMPGIASQSLGRWRRSPKAYFEEVLGVKAIWGMQEDLLKACPRAMKENKQIYVGSGHSLGKDWTCGGISLWFLHCFSPSIVLQTAPTDRQVKKVMWGETLSHWNNRKIDLGGVPYANPYLEINKADWYLLGFTTKETGGSADAGGGKFQGFHAPNLCVIVSEAQAVEDVIYDQIDGVATSENILVIFIGNPTRAKGRFAKGLRDKKNNIVFNFSCLENPNYIHRKTLIPGLASFEWVEDKRRKWGEDDPRWFGRVLGQIPDVSVTHVLGQKDIDHMMSRLDCLKQYTKNAGVSVDPAGEGDDDNIIMGGKGGEVVRTTAKTSMAPSVVAVEALDMCKEIEGNFIIVDCDGIGIGTYQELIKRTKNNPTSPEIIKFHGSGSTTEREGGKNSQERKVYQNRRAEAAFITQKRAREGMASIDPKELELIEDLMEEEYFENKKGLLQIEDKKDIKERLDRSPGRGDAYKMLQYAFELDIKPPAMRFTMPSQQRKLVAPMVTTF